MFNNKLKASLIHFLFSALLVGGFVAFALLVWYPDPILEISGLRNILLILVSVDLVLGPLLTFIVYKPLKKSLKFDLAAIIAVQLGALGYGMYTIYQGHPVYITYTVDRFTLVTAQEAKPETAKYPEYQVTTFGKPVYAFSAPPKDPEELSKLTLKVMSGEEPDIDQQPKYYEPFDKNLDAVLANKYSADKLQVDPANKEKLTAFLTKKGLTLEQSIFIPLAGKEKDVILVWNKETKAPVGYLDINPWKV